jgi:hypothetical protein
MCRDDPPLVKRVPPFGVDAKNSTSSSKYATASSGSAIFKRTFWTMLVVLFGKNAPPLFDSPTPTVLPLPKAALINPPKVFRDDDDIIIIIVFFFDGDSGGIEEEGPPLLLFANAVALEDALSMQSSSGGASSSSALVVVASLMISRAIGLIFVFSKTLQFSI